MLLTHFKYLNFRNVKYILQMLFENVGWKLLAIWCFGRYTRLSFLNMRYIFCRLGWTIFLRICMSNPDRKFKHVVKYHKHFVLTQEESNCILQKCNYAGSLCLWLICEFLISYFRNILHMSLYNINVGVFIFTTYIKLNRGTKMKWTVNHYEM